MSNARLDGLDPAIRSHGATFLHGPPGTGKSAIAERLIRVHTDNVLVPHAVEVDGQIIRLVQPGPASADSATTPPSTLRPAP